MAYGHYAVVIRQGGLVILPYREYAVLKLLLNTRISNYAVRLLHIKEAVAGLGKIIY